MACRMCSKPGTSLCSETCRRAANREIETNLAKLKAPPSGADSHTRYELTERNGELTSALLSWPESPFQPDLPHDTQA